MGDAYSKSVCSLLFGILSIIHFVPIPFFGLGVGLIFGITGLYFARLSHKELDYHQNQTAQWLALAGKVCCIFGIGINLLLFLAILSFLFFGFT